MRRGNPSCGFPYPLSFGPDPTWQLDFTDGRRGGGGSAVRNFKCWALRNSGAFKVLSSQMGHITLHTPHVVLSLMDEGWWEKHGGALHFNLFALKRLKTKDCVHNSDNNIIVPPLILDTQSLQIMFIIWTCDFAKATLTSILVFWYGWGAFGGGHVQPCFVKLLTRICFHFSFSVRWGCLGHTASQRTPPAPRGSPLPEPLNVAPSPASLPVKETHMVAYGWRLQGHWDSFHDLLVPAV